MRPVPVGLDDAMQAFLTDLRSAVANLQQPGQPQQEFALAFADLPPAENFKNRRGIVTDKNALAISTNVAGTWTWLRADGSAL